MDLRHSLPAPYLECINEVSTLDEAKYWILRKQLGQRNLGTAARSRLLALMNKYEMSKTPNPKGGGKHRGQNAHGVTEGRAVERVAKKTGVAPKTVQNCRFGCRTSSIRRVFWTCNFDWQTHAHHN